MGKVILAFQQITYEMPLMKTRRWLAASFPQMRFLLFFFLLLTGVFQSGCNTDSTGSDPERRKLVVLGIDAADWQLLAPMLDEGLLPNLQIFRDQSTYGKMKTFLPLQRSPVLWASICTGVRPEIHGIKDFNQIPRLPNGSASNWDAPALWDIVGMSGQTTAIIGMWTTYPARPIKGVMVSDFLAYRGPRDNPLVNVVYPDSLADQVQSLIVSPDSLTIDQLARFFPVDQLASLQERHSKYLDIFKQIWSADLTYLNVARHLAGVEDFDLFFFYLRGPDAVSHLFYRHLSDDANCPDKFKEDSTAFALTVPRYYLWVDEVLGEVLSWFPPERQVVICSDHGFKGPGKDCNRGTKEHREWGIFLVRSPYYKAGHEFDQIALLDLCPTFLGLLGDVPARDMPGLILQDGLTIEGLLHMENLEEGRVPSYMHLRAIDQRESDDDPAIREKLRQQLRALGYTQ